jgi:hypothetical protein
VGLDIAEKDNDRTSISIDGKADNCDSLTDTFRNQENRIVMFPNAVTEADVPLKLDELDKIKRRLDGKQHNC